MSTFMEASPIQEHSPKKSYMEDIPIVNRPRSEDTLHVKDDGSKPRYSYAKLISMAISQAPNQRLTFEQICQWISSNYIYYSNSKTSWRNGIRHNLSLNEAFIKQERSKNDPGKGNY